LPVASALTKFEQESTVVGPAGWVDTSFDSNLVASAACGIQQLQAFEGVVCTAKVNVNELAGL